ncbi:MAG: hypothetical protein ABR569_11220 [Gaiellaceae bacterium]
MHWNYTTYLNVIFLAVGWALVWRWFPARRRLAMPRVMDEPIGDAHGDHGAAGRT